MLGLGLVWGVISDFILSLLPWIMVWKLRMKKAEKYGLAVALSMGCVWVFSSPLPIPFSHRN